MGGSPIPFQESKMEAFNAAVKQAAETFFGGSRPTRNRYTRIYSVSWITKHNSNPPTDYVLRDFFDERGFEPRDVVVSAGGCSLFFALDTISQES
jgi:hypothetical protein